ncbi:MAG TPA: glucose-1-phosphate adenylyltransferase [Nitrospiraceae bacterium]|nr:glucose-1-phosphate adenylyltransferase [Nitrospiraceae bacterium]
MQRRRQRVLAIIMAGGKGERLMPLTAIRSKPSVPFGGKYRIIDFVLSNFVNSGVLAIYVLVQYKSQSLIEHLRQAWRIGGRIKNNFITVVPPQMRAGEGWYEGTADAVFQNLNLVYDFDPDVVAVFGADHIYRMDINEMLRSHSEREADVTVASLPVPLSEAGSFGIVEVDQDERVVGFLEKPKQANPMPHDPDRAYASMGNYVFNKDLLVEVLEQDATKPGPHDFGRNIIPHLLDSHRVFAYNFQDSSVPGVRSYEEPAYWRDVGTLDAYWQAHIDLLGERPIFDLRNSSWPILTDSYDGPMASLVRTTVDESMVGQGGQFIEANIRRSVIGRGVRIDSGARLEECVIADGVHIGAGARLRRVIADRFSKIPADIELGYGETVDRERFYVSSSGLIVLPRNYRFRSVVPNLTGSAKM